VATLLLDLYTHELIKLIGLATEILNEHENDHDLCAICGCAWPCERVVLAAQNLAVI
jgi:hypothetical protein